MRPAPSYRPRGSTTAANKGMGGGDLICQMCDEESHSAIDCPWVYSPCQTPKCIGIRCIYAVMNNEGKLRKYLACQFSTCSGFQWLDEAKDEANTSSGPSAGGSSCSDPVEKACFHCGLLGHWAKACPWIDTPCPRPHCTGRRKIRTSFTEQNYERKFFSCVRCNKFDWVPEWVDKCEASNLTKGKGQMVSIQVPYDEFCKDFIKKNAM